MNDATTPGPPGRDPQEVTVNESSSRGPEDPAAPVAADALHEEAGASSHGVTDTDDPALARLRAADPAASALPDVAALREAVGARLAPADPAASTDELAERRRRRWPLRVAAVAAGALVVGGGGGYAIGAAGGDGDAPSEPAIAVADPGGAGLPGMGGPGGDMATTEAARGGAAGDAAMSWPGFFGRTVFTASGLSGEGGTAQAWAFDPAGAFSAETAAAAAAALGVPGEPRQEDMFWTVGPADGTGPSLQLFADGTVSLSYYDPAKDPWLCAAPDAGGGTTGSSEGTEGGADAPVPEPCEERDLGAAPQGEAAEAELRGVLEALGEDAGGYELVAERADDERWSYVTAYQVVGGQRTGLAWGASFTGAGLQSLNGALADLVDLGEYAVVSPQEAVERLGDPRFGAGGGPVAYREGALAGEMDAAVPPTGPGELPQPPSPGSPVPWPVAEVTITDARLGVALQTQPDGAALLLPTYELTGADGSVWSVLAVAEEHLDLAAGR
ncbi:hypothetical protein [Actinotalea sp. Marseille-Q4924]|uniref:hypothetical protein n=1 Tax=Actinotalea sp. Marseille-Q4924 TaxID=2866571 RepID=UPI001CE48981|nr:hypothetical protein [Actinotalea sp. Marseille-Q4924]